MEENGLKGENKFSSPTFGGYWGGVVRLENLDNQAQAIIDREVERLRHSHSALVNCATEPSLTGVTALRSSSDYKKGVKASQTEKKAPIFTFCKQMKYSIEKLALRTEYGHQKYKEYDADYQNFSRVPNAEEEYGNALFRHALEVGGDEDRTEHLVAAAWNAIAKLEIHLRKDE